MSPRSLVGMTQGARSRLAKYLVWYLVWGDAATLNKPQGRRELLAEWPTLTSQKGGRAARALRLAYHEQRQELRIGERLRPCPGCPACLTCELCGKPAACLGKYDAMLHPAHHCDQCCAHGNEDGWCEFIGAECERCSADGVVAGEMSMAGDYHELECSTCKGACRVAICDGSGVIPARKRWRP